MDDQSFGTPTEPQRPVNSSASGFPGIVFLNKTGLRAGWRLLIYAALFFIFWSVSIYFLGLFLRPAWGVFSLSFQFFGELGSFLAAFLAAWIMSQLESRPMGVYGLPARGAFGNQFWLGCLFGLCEITALMLLISAFRGYSFGTLTERGGAIAKWALFWAIFFVVVALFEEFLFRGYAFTPWPTVSAFGRRPYFSRFPLELCTSGTRVKVGSASLACYLWDYSGVSH